MRRLDLDSGVVEDVFTPHGELQGTTGRSRGYRPPAPTASVSTRCTRSRDKGRTRRSFTSSTSDEMGALHRSPAEFVPSAARSTAMATMPDGTLLVANASTGELPEIDPVGLAIARSTSIEMPIGTGRSSAVADGETLYLASGTEVIAVDISTLSVKERWTLDEKITGLQITPDGELLYLGLSNDLAKLDVASGDIETIASSGIGKIRRFGPAPESVNLVTSRAPAERITSRGRLKPSALGYRGKSF